MFKIYLFIKKGKKEKKRADSRILVDKLRV